PMAAPPVQQEPLLEKDVAASPFRQFDAWYRHALEQALPEPTACTLATATRDGIPSARIVLLKGFDERGFVFFTNYASQKGRALATTARAPRVFFRPPPARQTRVVAPAAPVPPAESDAYFATRPRASQIGAWASAQSTPIASRADLEARA